MDKKDTAHIARILKRVIEQALDDLKAQNIFTIDLTKKSDLADFMIVASGTSRRHVSALAKKIREKVQATGLTHINSEGEDIGDWVLLDNPYIVVHLFRPEIRTYYNLERMWDPEFFQKETEALVVY